ncbi:cyclohexanecarboxylate-CoA ligase [Pseudomaricurvus alkylphenolicus]|uniref:class I adenylate-forming enzyme family protein n=1 Tax=Pseudomaricurvus alkylphenolicus TaxID=1306991 RepID=UPI0014240B65|nr:AMP-binding protein [Pseudomaricurvus alkylphenolicus]NIB38956.1 cyclohexanecarboxylate-CoA ligase [Pseudomaricurvus alkylphenolicus]
MNKQLTLWGLIAERARLTPGKRFCRDEHKRSLSFAEYRQEAERLALILHQRGISSGDRVAWQLPSWIDTLVVCAALARLGAVQMPLFPSLRFNEVSHLCSMAEPKLLITPATWKSFDYADMAARIQAQQISSMDTMTLSPPDHTAEHRDGSSGLERTLPEAQETVDDYPERWIYCTSGTTSSPKAARHSDLAFITVGHGMNAALELTSRDVVPIYFPFAHVGGLMWLVSSLLTGCELVMVEAFNDDGLRVGDSFGATIGGAGTAFHLGFQRYQQQSEGDCFSMMRCFTGGGAPKPPSLHYEMKDAFDCAGIISGYGMTECPIITMNTVRDPDDKLANTEGRLLPGMRVKIVDRNGQICGPGQEGEIRVKGPHLCLGFLDSHLNETAFDNEGYFRSGDLGHLDNEGWLTISGRLKDIIIRKGENISAKKVEDVLFLHALISDAVVVGIPDNERGEMACAVVTLAESQSEFDINSLQRHCLDKGLMIQEVPERWLRVDSLPRNASGKILKDQVRRQLLEPS